MACDRQRVAYATLVTCTVILMVTLFVYYYAQEIDVESTSTRPITSGLGDDVLCEVSIC